MTPRQRSTAASRQERRDNLRNLMALFEAMGATCATLPSGRRLRRSLSWPHRLWLDLDDHPPSEDDAVALLRAAPRRGHAILPDLGGPGGPLSAAFERAGLDVLFEQTLMTFHRQAGTPQTAAAVPQGLSFEQRTRDVDVWAETASEAFGYHVDPDTIRRLLADRRATLVTAWRHQHPVGTGLLYETGGVSGLHMIGVLPAARRMGIARHITTHLMALCTTPQIVLQASAMGAPLYHALGFQSHGTLTNYLCVGAQAPLA